MAYEQRKEFVREQGVSEPKVDIRVVRLVVSIMQCEQLSYGFLNMQKVDFALTRYAIDSTPIEQTYSDFGITQKSLEGFFEHLRRTSQAKFAGFVSYLVRNVFAEYNPPPYWSRINQTHFEDFVRDLQALGFKYEWSGGTEIALTPIVIDNEGEARLIDELDRMLLKVNPTLVETRRGAWNALLSGSEDSDRQAIASSRQLLAETLRTAGTGKDREERVRSILKDKDAEMVEAVAKLVDSVYDLQSKGEHAKPNFDRALYVIKLTEYSLHYILKNR
jgi:hypothetical protein